MKYGDKFEQVVTHHYKRNGEFISLIDTPR